jgi:hypothetical protein
VGRDATSQRGASDRDRPCRASISRSDSPLINPLGNIVQPRNA